MQRDDRSRLVLGGSEGEPGLPVDLHRIARREGYATDLEQDLSGGGAGGVDVDHEAIEPVAGNHPIRRPRTRGVGIDRLLARAVRLAPASEAGDEIVPRAGSRRHHRAQHSPQQGVHGLAPCREELTGHRERGVAARALDQERAQPAPHEAEPERRVRLLLEIVDNVVDFGPEEEGEGLRYEGPVLGLDVARVASEDVEHPRDPIRRDRLAERRPHELGGRRREVGITRRELAADRCHAAMCLFDVLERRPGAFTRQGLVAQQELPEARRDAARRKATDLLDGSEGVHDAGRAEAREGINTEQVLSGQELLDREPHRPAEIAHTVERRELRNRQRLGIVGDRRVERRRALGLPEGFEILRSQAKRAAHVVLVTREFLVSELERLALRQAIHALVLVAHRSAAQVDVVEQALRLALGATQIEIGEVAEQRRDRAREPAREANQLGHAHEVGRNHDGPAGTIAEQHQIPIELTHGPTELAHQAQEEADALQALAAELRRIRVPEADQLEAIVVRLEDVLR